VLVTNDRGKKDREIFELLASRHVHAIFVHDDLRNGPPHRLTKAILNAEGKMDEVVSGSKLLSHRLRVGGGLEKRR
jgi:hypothetical protein